MDQVDPDAVLANLDANHGDTVIRAALRAAIAQRDEAKYRIAELERALEDARDALR